MTKMSGNSSTPAARNLLLRQIRNFIAEKYIPTIDQTDLAKHSPIYREHTLLSRGLAAMTAHNLAFIEVTECTRLVVDQSRDNGIDAVAFDPAAGVLYLIQAKYIHDGNGGPTTDGVLKLIKGFNELIDDEMENFGPKMTKIYDEIRAIMDRPGVKFTLVYVHTGSQDAKEDQISSLNRLKKEFNATLNPHAVPLLEWKICKLSTVYEWIQTESSHRPINLE